VRIVTVPALEIDLTRHCFGCAEALRLADSVAARSATVSVRVVDLEREPDARPAGLVAVPTYILDGRVISLGNPNQTELFGRIGRALRASQVEEGRNGRP
jgi:hypothetical protein